MATRPELTESEILQKMRDHVNRQQPGAVEVSTPPPAPLPQPVPAMDGWRYDLGRLRHAFDAVSSLAPDVGALGPRRKGLKNEAVRLGTKVIRSLLSWLIGPVRQFNAAVARAMGEHMRGLESMQHQIDAAVALQSAETESMQHQIDAAVALQSAETESMQHQIDAAVALQSAETESLQKHIDTAVALQHDQIA